MERDRLLVLLRERIVAFAASHYGREVAEDVAQETLMVLHEKYGHLAEAADLMPLALRIAHFKLAGMRRKAFRRGEHTATPVEDAPIEATGGNPEELAGRRETIERLSRAIAALGDRCRTLIRYKLEGRSYAEIRELMGAASLNTVYTWDFRCRRQLLEKMGGSWEEWP